MMPKKTIPFRTQQTQSGAALAVSLIFLVILTLLAVSAMQATSMEERMSGNSRSRSVAFQAAEAALRDAEDYILTKLPADYNADCTNGLCNPNASTPVMHDWKTYQWNDGKYVEYGTAPSPAAGKALPDNSHGGVARQPRYYIELKSATPTNIDPGTGVATPATFYTIIACGWGGDLNTKVLLREVYITYK